MITIEQFKKCFPRAKQPEVWVKGLNEKFPEYEIDTKEKVAAYLAQCGHESGGFTRLEENLMYGAQGLLKTFGKYFDEQKANEYAKKPQKIASRVYGNRMGNGDEASGEGYKYRGRGLIQLTGKNNYIQCSNDIRGDSTFVDDPDYLTTFVGAIESSLWFWKKNNLNQWVEKGDFDGLCDVINRGRKTQAIGDAIGYTDRRKHFEDIKKILNA